MAAFPFELVSPERLVFSEQVDEVVVPGIEGEFTVLAGHAPFISVLKPGIITIKSGGRTRAFYVRGGLADVNPQGLTILADNARSHEEVDQGFVATEITGAEAAVLAARDPETRLRAQDRLNHLISIEGTLGFKLGSGASTH